MLDRRKEGGKKCSNIRKKNKEIREKRKKEKGKGKGRGRGCNNFSLLISSIALFLIVLIFEII